MFFLNGGDITNTGNKREAGPRGEENEFSLGHVVLEMPEKYLAGRQEPGNKSLSSGEKSACRYAWQLLV